MNTSRHSCLDAIKGMILLLLSSLFLVPVASSKPTLQIRKQIFLPKQSSLSLPVSHQRMYAAFPGPAGEDYPDLPEQMMGGGYPGHDHPRTGRHPNPNNPGFDPTNTVENPDDNPGIPNELLESLDIVLQNGQPALVRAMLQEIAEHLASQNIDPHSHPEFVELVEICSQVLARSGRRPPMGPMGDPRMGAGRPVMGGGMGMRMGMGMGGRRGGFRGRMMPEMDMDMDEDEHDFCPPPPWLGGGMFGGRRGRGGRRGGRGHPGQRRRMYEEAMEARLEMEDEMMRRIADEGRRRRGLY